MLLIVRSTLVMNNRYKSIIYNGIIAAALASAIGAAQAGGADSWSLRAGAAHLSPNDSSGGLSTAPTIKIGADSDTSLGLTATYTYTDTLGVGVLAGVDVELKDSWGLAVEAGVGLDI